MIINNHQSSSISPHCSSVSCDICSSENIQEPVEGYVCGDCGIVLEIQKFQYTGWWKDAPWMETHTFNQFALDFQYSKPELRWYHIARYFGDDRTWLETLQFHLNVGVYYCAAAINSLLVHYTGCSSSVEEDWNRSAAKFTAEYAFCFLFAFMGNFALLYVFTNTAISTLASKLGVPNIVVPS